MNKNKKILSFFIFLVFSPLLIIEGQNYKLWDLNNFFVILSENFSEKILYYLFYPIFILYQPTVILFGTFEKILNNQSHIFAFIFILFLTLLYCYLLSSIIFFILKKIILWSHIR